MIPLEDRKQRETKEPLDESEKAGLQFNIQKLKIMSSGPITSWQIDGEKVETVADFIFFILQNHCGQWLAAIKLKDACSLEESCD